MLTRGDFARGIGLAALGSSAAWPQAAGARPVIVNAGPGLLRDLTYPDRATLAPPPVPFNSNHNYFIYGGGTSILGLVVTIEPTEDLVAPDAMSMQLNCYSPAGASCVYQQYVTGMSSLAKSKTLLFGSSIENFPSTAYRAQLHDSIGLHAKGDLFNEHFHFGHFPVPSGRIPAGWKVKWELLNNPHDPSGAITGAKYSVTTDSGRVETSGVQLIKNFKFHGTNVPVTPVAMAPILALQMNMVGTNGGQFMHISSGAGTITYEASTNLVPLGRRPANLAAGNTSTQESSNIRYAELGAQPRRKIVQKFRATG